MGAEMTQRYCDGITRRDSLKFGALALGGLGLTPQMRLHAAERESRADAVLFVNLAGGPSHLDTLDMKPEAPAETRSEFSSIQSSVPGLAICEHLPKLAATLEQFALIRGISHTTGDHPQGQAYIATGNRPGPALKYPSYGSIVMRELPASGEVPPYVAVPQTEWNAGYMGDAYAPFSTNAVPKPGEPFAVRGITLAEGMTLEKVNRREQLLRDLDTTFRGADSQLLEALGTFGGQAHGMITSPLTREAFDVSQEPQSIQDKFAADELNQSLLLAIRLIAHGSRFVTVTNTGWDTHLDNFVGHARLMPPLDAGLFATLETLVEKGLLERTLVVVMGEFGRTPKVNQNVGRDHYPRANWCLMAGGGVAPGLIGGTDQNGEGPDEDTDLHPDDLGASILYALGIDHHAEYYTKTGRPVSLVPHGRVIESLFG